MAHPSCVCVCVQEETERGLPLKVPGGPHAPAAAAAAEHTQDKRLGEEEEEVTPVSVTHSLSFLQFVVRMMMLCNIPLSCVKAVGCVFLTSAGFWLLAVI